MGEGATTAEANAEARRLAKSKRHDVADHAARTSSLLDRLWRAVLPSTEFPLPGESRMGRGKSVLRQAYKDAQNVPWTGFPAGIENQGRFVCGWLACLLAQRRSAMRHANASDGPGWDVRRLMSPGRSGNGRRSVNAGVNPRANAVAICHHLSQLVYDQSNATYLARVVETLPAATVFNRRATGIIPHPFAVPTTSRVFVLPANLPDTPGPVEPAASQTIPGIPEAESPRPSLVMALFDASLRPERHMTAKRKIALHLFVEFLLGIPVEQRRDRLVQIGPISIRELVVDWLQWDPAHYGPNDRRTGAMLRQAVSEVRTMVVPWGAHGGYYVPLMVLRVTGWRLKDTITMMAQVPPGGHVGPSVDRTVLRFLGAGAKGSDGKRRVGAFAAWRMYLALAFDWDAHGGRTNSRAPVGRKHGLIRPTRPTVERDGNGRILDQDGKPLKNVKGYPVNSPFHPRAVPTGGREPNPARHNYPAKSANDLVALTYAAFPKSNISVYRRRALDAALILEEFGICVIERLGVRGHKLPWRVMPPDHQ